MPSLVLHLLGPLRARAGDGRDLTFGYPRQTVQALLAYLLLHRVRPIPRLRLAAALWPDLPEPQALASLRRTLHILGRALPTPPEGKPPFLLVRRLSVGWNSAADFWLDLAEFDRVVAGGSPAELAQAVDLYAGDLLEDLSEEWVPGERARRLARPVDALDRLIAHERDGRRPGRAIDLCRRLLAVEPWREKTHRDLMELLYRAGDRTAALQQFEECRRTLRAELAVEPLAETRDLYDRIARGEPLSPTAAPPPSLAAPPATPTLRTHPGPAGLDPPLAGREAELALLEAAWSDARAGRGETILIYGEAGVGKSRLLAELIHGVRDRCAILVGSGHLPERLLPYHPLVEAIRGLGADLAERLPISAASPRPWWLSKLARLLPELQEIRPTQPTAAPSPQGPSPQVGESPFPSSEAPEDRLRLLEALVRAFGTLTAWAPVLLVLDDLHWADESTLAWLEYATTHLRDAPILIAATFRAEEETPTLAQVRRSLAHAGAARELRLDRLTASAVAELIQEMAGSGGAIHEFSRRLHRETEGNALFLVETLRSLADAGLFRPGRRGWQGDWKKAAAALAHRPLPPTVREVIRSRWDRISDPSRQVLEAAAVLGRRFDDRLVGHASGRSETETIAAIEEGLRAQLIAEHEDAYRFTHDKIQEVAYASLSLPRRRRLHHRLGEVLESTRGRDPERAGQLAHHFERAEVWEKVAPYAGVAARRAKHLYTSEEALAYYALALKALGARATSPERARAPESILQERFDVLSERQGVWMLAGRFEEARRDLAEMADLARRLADDGRLADALNGLGNLHVNTGRPDQARAPLEEALAAKRRLGDRAGEADSLNMLGPVYFGQGEVDRGLAFLEEGRVLRRSFGDPAALAPSEWMFGLAHYEFTGEYLRAIAHLSESRALSRSAGNRALECGSLQLLGAAHVRVGDFPTARDFLDRALALARAIGDRAAEGWAQLYLSRADTEEGNPAAALERGQIALATGRAASEHTLGWYALYSLARLSLELGDREAARRLADVASELAVKQTLWPNCRLRAHVLAARVRSAAAPADLAAAAATIRRLSPDLTRGIPELRLVCFDSHLTLRAARAPEAEDFLARAHAELMRQARAIPDGIPRRRFLANLAVNRAIAAEWQAYRAAASGSEAR
jgi:DNA-binding SARP family transcriptional activator/tetratricopeptide (TPR) repeat protein